MFAHLFPRFRFFFGANPFNGELTFTASIQATAQIHLEEGYVEDEDFPSSSSTCFTAPRYKPTMAGELSEGQGSQLACCAQSSSVFQGDFNKIYVMFIKCVVLWNLYSGFDVMIHYHAIIGV